MHLCAGFFARKQRRVEISRNIVGFYLTCSHLPILAAAVAGVAWTTAADIAAAASNSSGQAPAGSPDAEAGRTIPLPPAWSSTAGTEAEGTCTAHRLPICNQQTLAEMEAQGVPRFCAVILHLKQPCTSVLSRTSIMHGASIRAPQFWYTYETPTQCDSWLDEDHADCTWVSANSQARFGERSMILV